MCDQGIKKLQICAIAIHLGVLLGMTPTTSVLPHFYITPKEKFNLMWAKKLRFIKLIPRFNFWL